MAKTIVFYFSATNTTKQRAEKIASKLGADLFAIQAEKHLAGFATSGSSGFERAQSYLERTVNENNADVQVLPGAVLNNDAQMDAWLKQLNLN